MLPLIIDRMPVHRYAFYGGIDAFNAQEQERKHLYLLDKARQELQGVHQRLVEYLMPMPEKPLAMANVLSDASELIPTVRGARTEVSKPLPFDIHL